MHRTTAESLREKIFVEQVRSLFVNLTPATVMLVAYSICVTIAWLDFRSRPLEIVGTLGWMACAARVGVTALLRDHALTAALDVGRARRLELLFAVPYLLFSGCLGAFVAMVFLIHATQMHMMTICLVVGYCAGVATNCGQRSWLAIASMVMAVGPPIAVCFFAGDPAYVATALIATAFLVAGSQTVLVRHRQSEREIGQRLSAALLARHDTLTSLPNRLALAEFFRESEEASPHRLLAVHYLDLDGFKQVNDVHGHGVGDALLAEVAERLRIAIRAGDIAARLGGDEFVVVQFGMGNAAEADVLARRIRAAIKVPFEIGGLRLVISTSVGTVVSHESGEGLESLLGQADARLYQAKRAGDAAHPHLRLVSA